MNEIQLKLEHVYKEYIEYKNFVELDNRTKEEIMTDIAKKTIGENVDYGTILFEDYGIYKLERDDFNKIALKLYNYYYAFESFAEIPEYIAEEVKKINVRQMFLVKNGKKEIIDKEYFDLTKKQFLAAIEEQKSQELKRRSQTIKQE